MTDLQTGDLLLFVSDSSSWFFRSLSNMISWGTHSNYTHIAMVLRDPVFSDMPPLKGLYVWESSWEGKPDPQDGKIKLGVQITPLQEILEAYKDKGHVFLRKLKRNLHHHCPTCCQTVDHLFTKEKLEEIHTIVYDKPYDIVPRDWIEAFFHIDSAPQKTSRFWCAALVGYIYTKVGILKPETDWSILTPNDFSLSGENLDFKNGNVLEDVIKKIE
uniref:Peptidase n=1 Tax=viral metagenome TaxID=1070528 RepID=A0A6C0C1K3_9ZZZZ